MERYLEDGAIQTSASAYVRPNPTHLATCGMTDDPMRALCGRCCMYGCLIPLIQMGGAEIMRPMMNKWEETRTISKPNTENVTATGNRR